MSHEISKTLTYLQNFRIQRIWPKSVDIESMDSTVGVYIAVLLDPDFDAWIIL